jgi:uncharacterized protein (DUF2236 family)
VTDDVEPFGPGSLLWEMMGDQRFLLVFPGALVMQVMHPAIGSAVGEFSVYRSDPWGRAVRSIDSVMLWVYGGGAALDEGRRLRKLHQPIKGIDNHGASYQANAAEPFAWVHATGYERLVTFRKLFATPLSIAEQDRLYDEHLQLGAILRIPSARMPGSRAAYWEYFDDVVRTRLEAHPTALDVMSTMRENVAVPPAVPAPLRRLWPPAGRAGGRFGHWLTVATFPPEVRALLGLDWSAADQRRLDRVAAAVRAVGPRLPERVRYHPYAHSARRLQRHQGRMADRALTAVVAPTTAA